MLSLACLWTQKFVGRIQLARWCAFAATSLMWIDGERSCAMTVTRSRLVVTYGSTVSYTEYLTSKGTWPIVNILHLLTNNCNCHVEAHSTIKSRAPCNITVSDTFTICKYTLTSPANNFTIIPWLSNSFANSSVYTRTYVVKAWLPVKRRNTTVVVERQQRSVTGFLGDKWTYIGLLLSPTGSDWSGTKHRCTPLK